ncbi:MAG: FkbM family methyltransferase [Ignavibacteriales bacterium]|nr:FkbM family methyltransferase [Ignavibacteriales bacterium]MCF8317076.1 FkbM family methyltransferase [Ignavibacteriales bacterium]MCF8438655.1 FkbM family methyltransferase [Ignavibacteriales bacterium]
MTPDLSGNTALKFTHTLSKLRYLHIRGIATIIEKFVNIVPLPARTGPVIVSTSHGFKLVVDPLRDKGIEESVFKYGSYEEGTLAIIKALLSVSDPNGVFIDVGANIGLISLFVSKSFNNTFKIHAFEPLPSTFSILEKNIKLNNAANIIPMRNALGSANSKTQIFESTSVNRGASGFIRDSEKAAGFETEIFRLDDFVNENKIELINCIKIDVEGWELEVLRGSGEIFSTPAAPACIIEYSPDRETFGGDAIDIYRFFKVKNNYRVFRLSHGKEKPSHLAEVYDISGLPKHDNIVCLKERHISLLPPKIFK